MCNTHHKTFNINGKISLGLLLLIIFFSNGCRSKTHWLTTIDLNQGRGIRLLALNRMDHIIYTTRGYSRTCKTEDSCSKIKKKWSDISNIITKKLINALRIHPYWYKDYVEDLLKQVKIELRTSSP
jgi:hypothetical protein